MDTKCQGDLFSADSRSWWRCRLDGTIVALPADELHYHCPHCNRPADGNDLGEVRTRTKVEVFLPGWEEWLQLPEGDHVKAIDSRSQIRSQ